MSNIVYSRVIVAFVLTYTAMFALGGRVIDALGTRLGLGLSVGLWSLACVLHGFASGAWTLAIARCLLGVGEGPCIPGVVKGAVQWSTPKQRASAIGFANSGSAFGSLVAPPLSVCCAQIIGWRGTFIFVALLGALWLVVWYFVVRQLPKVAPPKSRDTRVAFDSLLDSAPVRRLLLARFCFDPVCYFYMFWIPQYFATERGMSLEDIGALVWIPFFTLGIANIVAGRLSDIVVIRGRAPRDARMLLMLIAALVTPVSCLVAFANSPGMAVALMSLLMFAHGIWIANYIALISDTVPSQQVATTVGLSGTCGGMAAILSSLTIGLIVDRFSFRPVFIVSALLYPLAWIVIRTGATRHYSTAERESA